MGWSRWPPWPRSGLVEASSTSAPEPEPVVQRPDPRRVPDGRVAVRGGRRRSGRTASSAKWRGRPVRDRRHVGGQQRGHGAARTAAAGARSSATGIVHWTSRSARSVQGENWADAADGTYERPVAAVAGQPSELSGRPTRHRVHPLRARDERRLVPVVGHRRGQADAFVTAWRRFRGSSSRSSRRRSWSSASIGSRWAWASTGARSSPAPEYVDVIGCRLLQPATRTSGPAEEWRHQPGRDRQAGGLPRGWSGYLDFARAWACRWPCRSGLVNAESR